MSRRMLAAGVTGPVLVSVLALGCLLPAAPAFADAVDPDDATSTTTSTTDDTDDADAGTTGVATVPKLSFGYPGDATSEAKLVASEDRRLIDVRSIANAAQWTGVAQHKPYRLVTGNTYTLVLVERTAPYTLDDLASLAPRTFVRQPDGAYVLGENVVVEEGATLKLSSQEGTTLRLASSSTSFVSIVTLGGSLEITGTPENPIKIGSWDDTAGAVDGDTADGRAYLRVVGGHAEFSNVEFDSLGFWSGATGGVSMTGTELPDETAADETEEGAPPPPAGPPVVFGSELLPTEGDVSTLDAQADLTGYSYVSARVQSVKIRNNAYGLFVSGADGVVVRDTSVTGSLVDGIVFHRNVTNSEISGTTSKDNAVDGIAVLRASTGVNIDRVKVSGNGRNGITLNGGTLADGPSATGLPVAVYGNNTVSDSTASSNARYGIEVVGGKNVTVDGNTVRDHAMGVVVDTGAEGVTITDNVIEGSAKQGIALRDAGTDTTVTSNTIVGGEVGIYARNAGGEFTRNRIEDVSNHGITLVGATGASLIARNDVSGSGPSAVDTSRGAETELSLNVTDKWHSTKPLDVVLRSIFQPLTVMWLILGLIVVGTAVAGLGRRQRGVIVDPYGGRAPLSTFTRGVIDPREARAIARAKAVSRVESPVVHAPAPAYVPAAPPVPAAVYDPIYDNTTASSGPLDEQLMITTPRFSRATARAAAERAAHPTTAPGPTTIDAPPAGAPHQAPPPVSPGSRVGSAA